MSMTTAGLRREPASPRLVLLVDDYEDTRELFAAVLEAAGFEVAQAEDAREALRLAAERAPDIVVTDLSLPDMDGCELTRELKSDGRTMEIPVLALSAHGSYARMRESIDAGCVAFVSKARSPRFLAEEIRRVLET